MRSGSGRRWRGAEAVTDIQNGHASDAVYEEVRAEFSDVEDGEFDAGDYDYKCVE